MNCTYTTSQPEACIDGRKPLIEQVKVIEKDDSDDEPIDITRNSKTSFFDKKLRDTIVTKSYQKTFRDLNSTSRNDRENYITMEVLCTVIDNWKYIDKGFEYLEENSHKICVDCACFLDKIKLRIQRLLKQKVVFNNKALPPPLEEEKDTFADHIMNVSHAIES